jgi:hypothetical protein
MTGVARRPQGWLALFQYVALVDNWFRTRGAPSHGQGFWVSTGRKLDETLAVIASQENPVRESSQGGAPPVMDDSYMISRSGDSRYLLNAQISPWGFLYGAPMNVASGEFHRKLLDGAPATDLLPKWESWMASWYSSRRIANLREGVRSFRFNSGAERVKAEVFAALSRYEQLSTSDEPGPAEARPIGSADGVSNVYANTGSFAFIRSFVRGANHSLVVLSHSVTPEGVEVCLRGIGPVENVSIIAERIRGRNRITRFLLEEERVRHVDLRRCPRLHAKVILRDRGQETSAVLVGSANMQVGEIGTSNRRGAFQVLASSRDPAAVAGAQDLVDRVVGDKNRPPEAAAPSPVLHSLAGGGIPSKLMDYVAASRTVRIFAPFFVDEKIYGALIAVRAEKAADTPDPGWFEFYVGWPRSARPNIRFGLARLRALQTEKAIDLHPLAPDFHGKVYLFTGVDGRSSAFVSSVNLTEGSWLQSIEAGIMIEEPTVVRALYAALQAAPRSAGNEIMPSEPHSPRGDGREVEVDDIPEVPPVGPIEGAALAERFRELYETYRRIFEDDGGASAPPGRDTVEELVDWDDEIDPAQLATELDAITEVGPDRAIADAGEGRSTEIGAVPHSSLQASPMVYLYAYMLLRTGRTHRTSSPTPLELERVISALGMVPDAKTCEDLVTRFNVVSTPDIG